MVLRLGRAGNSTRAALRVSRPVAVRFEQVLGFPALQVVAVDAGPVAEELDGLKGKRAGELRRGGQVLVLFLGEPVGREAEQDPVP